MPAPGDTGHTAMCQYVVNPVGLMTDIDREKPLSGERLSAVLSWQRNGSAAGCYCDSSSRDHKWGLVLETIHYALVPKRTHRGIRSFYEDASTGRNPQAALAWRRSHGDATYVRWIGTRQLQARQWNLINPERVLAIQRRYVEVSSGLPYYQHLWRLAHHAQSPFWGRNHVVEVNKGRRGDSPSGPSTVQKMWYVLGDIGPFGGLLQPFRRIY